jgi:flagellar hook-associated protein 2
MRIGGLASGMDIDSIVGNLMKAERMPLDKLFQRKQIIDWQRDAYREMNLALSKFRDTYSNMRLQSTFTAYSATSSNSSIVTGTATSSAVPGTYNVVVENLAKSGKLNSASAIIDLNTTVSAKSTDKVLLTGSPNETFTVTNGQGLVATITVDGTDTYATLANKINNASDDTTGASLGLRASFDDTTSRFFISTKDMGGDKSFTLQNTTFVQNQILGGGTTFSATGQYGSLTFDGIAVNNLTTNETTVNGINLKLLKEDPATTVSITVQTDTDAAFSKIKDFVDGYNKLVDEIHSKLRETKYRDYPPLTNEQREGLSDTEAEKWDKKSQSGMLRNDAMLRSVLNDLRSSLYEPVEGINTGELRQLAEIGITTGDYRSDGKLYLDETKLRKALTDKPEEVMNLFTKTAEVEGSTSQMGLGRRIYEDLNAAIKKITQKAGYPGTTLSDQSTLGKSITQIGEQMFRWEDRLGRIENRYWRQFTAMEKALDKMNQQSAWMSQNMFGGM